MMKYWLKMDANRQTGRITAYCLLLSICLLTEVIHLNGEQNVLSQTIVRAEEKKTCCKQIKVTFSKRLISGDDLGKYALYFISFPESAYDEKNIECVVKILREKVKNKRAKVFLWDDPAEAELIASGRSHDYKAMTSTIRGMYYLYPRNKEYIKYSPSVGEPWDSKMIEFENPR